MSLWRFIAVKVFAFLGRSVLERCVRPLALGSPLSACAQMGQMIDGRYPADLSSIPRATQAVWLKKPSTPLVLDEVFNRRKNLVTSDLHVLLVTSDKSERAHMKRELDGLGYKTTVATSGKSAMEMLATRGGDFHVVLTSVGLTASDSAGEGPNCAGLLAWAPAGGWGGGYEFEAASAWGAAPLCP